MKKLLCFCLGLLILSAVVAYAHNGRTDYKGGHYVGETSEYHYHHGYPAHDHSNGKCPYEFDEKAAYTLSNVSTEFSKPKAAATAAENSWGPLTPLEITGLVFLGIYLIVGFAFSIYSILSEKDLGCLIYVFGFPMLVTFLIALPISYIYHFIKNYREAKSRNITMRQLKAEYIKKANAQEGDFPVIQRMYDYYDDDD